MGIDRHSAESARVATSLCGASDSVADWAVVPFGTDDFQAWLQADEPEGLLRAILRTLDIFQRRREARAEAAAAIGAAAGVVDRGVRSMMLVKLHIYIGVGSLAAAHESAL